MGGTDGAGELASIMSVSVQGAQFGLQVSKESIILARKIFELMLSMIKTTSKLKNLKMVKKIGRTNIINLMERKGNDLQYLKLDHSTYQHISNALKKNGVLYCKLPLEKFARNTDSIFLQFSSQDAVKIEHVLGQYREKLCSAQKKDPQKCEAIKKEFEKNNSFLTAEELLKESGLDTEIKTFESQMKEIFGDDYVNITTEDFKKNEFLTPSQKNDFSKVAENILKDERKNSLKEKLVYSFEADQTHIVGQTNDMLKILISENEKACVWVPKRYIDPPLNELAESGIHNIIVDSGSEETFFLVQSIDDGVKEEFVLSPDVSEILNMKKENIEKGKQELYSLSKKNIDHTKDEKYLSTKRNIEKCQSEYDSLYSAATRKSEKKKITFNPKENSSLQPFEKLCQHQANTRNIVNGMVRDKKIAAPIKFNSRLKRR